METRNINRPTCLINPQGEYLPQSWKDEAFQGDLNGGSNLVYVGFAKPGSPTSAPVWKIFFITYSGGIPVSITWPIGADGAVSKDYEFIWDDRASYTYV
jgi:hypothetical protein